MVRIKRWEAFLESVGKEVPERFVFLDSIGYYMDPVYGGFYEGDGSGGFSDQVASLDDVLGEEELDADWDQLSDIDRDAVNSAWRSAEDLVKPLLDWDLIDDIKQVAISEEILDKGMFVRIRANLMGEKIDDELWQKMGMRPGGDETVYVEMFGKGDEPYYPKMFGAWRDLLKGMDRSCISYAISVMRPNHGGFVNSTVDISDRKLSYFDQIQIDSIQHARDFWARVNGMHPGIGYEKW